MFYGGMAVFAKITIKAKPWPALIIDPQDAGMVAKDNYKIVFWIGDNRLSHIKEMLIMDFMSHYRHIFQKFNREMGPKWHDGVNILIKHFGAPDTNGMTNRELHLFAMNNYFPETQCEAKELPINVSTVLGLRKLEMMDRVYDKPKNFDAFKKACNTNKQLTHICICCYDCEDLKNHPIFNAKACIRCLGILKHTAYVLRDGNYEFCTVCGGSNNIRNCKDPSCSKTFCSICCGRMSFILRPNTCIICEPNVKPIGWLTLRDEWQFNIVKNMLYGKHEIEFKNLDPLPINIEILHIMYGSSPAMVGIPEIHPDLQDENSQSYYKMGHYINHKDEYAEGERKFVLICKNKLKSSLVMTENEITNIDWLIGGWMKINHYQKDGLSAIKTFLEFYRVMNMLDKFLKKKVKFIFSVDLDIQYNDVKMINRWLKAQPLFHQINDNKCLYWSRK